MNPGNRKINGGRGAAFFLTGILLTSIAWGPSARAETVPTEDRRIVSLEINSKVGLTIESLSRMTGIRTGIPYSPALIRQSLDSLYATGLFTNIVVETDDREEGVAVVYTLYERALLTQIRIRGNRVFWDPTLTRAMDLQIGEEFTEDHWKTGMNRLLQFLHRKGYFQAEVHSEAAEVPGTNQVQLTVTVREGLRAKIRRLRFEGEVKFYTFRMWTLFRSLPGEFYDADLVDRDIARLEGLYREHGYLKAIIGPPAVTLHETANEVTLAVPIEAGTRLVLQFEGAEPISPFRLTPLLLFGEERSYDESVFRVGADRLAAFYQSQGYPFVQAEFNRTVDLNANEVRGTYSIRPGPYSCLKTVLFMGNTFFTPDRLQGLIQTRPGSLLWCGIADPPVLKQDTKLITTRYLEQGFQDVKIEPQVRYNEKRTEAYLIFAVAEGPRTLVEETVFEGNQALTDDQLRTTIKLEPGRPFDTVPFRRDQEEVLALYSQKGYLYAQLTPTLEFSPDRTRVTIRHSIQEGKQVRVGRILLSGNTTTRDQVILRELRIGTDDPYDETRILLSRHRIQRLGYLGNVRFEPIGPISRTDTDAVKDMRLTLQERPAKALDLGVGYASEERLRGFIQGTHMNLWGTGRSMTLRGEGSRIETKYSATYREPWLLGYEMDGRLVGFIQSQDRPTYNLVTVGGTAGIEKSFTPQIKTVLQYQFENNRFKQVAPEIQLLPEDERANIASLNPAIFWDTRNDPFNPKSGFFNAVTFRNAALLLGSEVQLVKGTVQSSWYFPVTSWMVLALSARAGAADRFGETAAVLISGSKDLVPPSERFYLGGRTTVRGYEQDALGIVGETILPKQDLTGVEFIGGNAMLLFNAEIRLFLPGNFGLVLFNDRGNVFLDYKSMDVNLLKSSVGAGLWYGTPVGPLRLDYGYKLDRETTLCPACPAPVEESRGELHFTLGFAF